MEVVPEFLNEHVKCHTSSRKLAVMGNVQVAPDVTRTGIVRYLSTRGVHKLNPGEPMPFKYLCFSNASIPKSILLEVGLFDEHIREYGGEDLELSFRLNERGDIGFIYTPQAVSYHLHYRTLADVCRLMYNYGQTSLSYMIQKHPKLKETVKAHFLEPIRFDNDGFLMVGEKILFRTAMNPVMYRILKWYATRSNLGWPSIVYDYIIAYNYVSGFKNSHNE